MNNSDEVVGRATFKKGGMYERAAAWWKTPYAAPIKLPGSKTMPSVEARAISNANIAVGTARGVSTHAVAWVLPK